jgi:alanine dehydrogenase
MDAERQNNHIDVAKIYRTTKLTEWGPAIDVPTLSSIETGILVRRALAHTRAGLAYGSKLVVSPAEEEMRSLLGGDTCGDFLDGERLNWKLSALIGVNESYGAIKIVGSNAYNRRSELPRSQSTILLFDKLTMRPLCMLDGTQVSAARTGAYASIVAGLFRPAARNLRIFVLGTGAVARSVVRDLSAHIGPRIASVHVKGRSPSSGEAMIADCAGSCDFAMKREDDLTVMRECDMIVTATNAARPIFQASDVGPHTVVAHFGGDETPAEFVANVLANGTIMCDDAASVGRRNSQSLALYFSRQGRSLANEAGALGIVDIDPAMRLPDAAMHSPALVTCVGLPMLDLYLAQRLYESSCELAETCGAVIEA